MDTSEMIRVDVQFAVLNALDADVAPHGDEFCQSLPVQLPEHFK